MHRAREKNDDVLIHAAARNVIKTHNHVGDFVRSPRSQLALGLFSESFQIGLSLGG